jgi:hypothetical protein
VGENEPEENELGETGPGEHELGEAEPEESWLGEHNSRESGLEENQLWENSWGGDTLGGLKTVGEYVFTVTVTGSVNWTFLWTFWGLEGAVWYSEPDTEK